METKLKQVECPKCGSTQITANQQGFSGGKAVAGEILLGPIGLLAGTAGSKKIIITCLSCGNQFRPGQTASSNPSYKTIPNKKPATRAQIKAAKVMGIILSFISVPLTILMFGIHEIGFGILFLIPTALFVVMAIRKVPEIKR